MPNPGLCSLVLACSLIAVAARAEPGTTPAAWKKHVRQVAGQKGLVVCRWGQLRYQHRGKRPGFFAVVVDARKDGGAPQRVGEAVLLGRGGFERWHDADETYSLDGACDGSGVAASSAAQSGALDWEDLDVLPIHFSGGISYRFMRDTVTFLDGELVHLAENWGDVDGSHETDWIAAERWDQERAADGAIGNEQRDGLVVVLPPGSPWLPRWRTPTFVTFGAKNRRARGDADLAVKAVEPTPESITIQIDLEDDRLVPVVAGADDKQFLRGDHLEIWWTHPGYGKEVPGNRQLGVGLLADGTADVRWLIPPPGGTHEPPVVRRSGTHVEIDLPVTRIAERDRGKPSWSTAFTVAFSDADDPKAGQQTVIATSTLRWNRADTFGVLARFDSANRRFPPF